MVENVEVGKGEIESDRVAYTQLSCALCLTTAKNRPKVEQPRTNIKVVC